MASANGVPTGAPRVVIPVPDVHMGVYRHEDGTFWAQVVLTLGSTQYTFAVPETQIDTFRNSMYSGFGQVQAEIKKAQSGLVTVVGDDARKVIDGLRR